MPPCLAHLLHGTLPVHYRIPLAVSMVPEFTYTLALFFRHSVQAFDVTKARPLRLLGLLECIPAKLVVFDEL